VKLQGQTDKGAKHPVTQVAWLSQYCVMILARMSLTQLIRCIWIGANFYLCLWTR